MEMLNSKMNVPQNSSNLASWIAQDRELAGLHLCRYRYPSNCSFKTTTAATDANVPHLATAPADACPPLPAAARALIWSSPSDQASANPHRLSAPRVRRRLTTCAERHAVRKLATDVANVVAELWHEHVDAPEHCVCLYSA